MIWYPRSSNSQTKRFKPSVNVGHKVNQMQYDLWKLELPLPPTHSTLFHAEITYTRGKKLVQQVPQQRTIKKATCAFEMNYSLAWPNVARIINTYNTLNFPCSLWICTSVGECIVWLCELVKETIGFKCFLLASQTLCRAKQITLVYTAFAIYVHMFFWHKCLCLFLVTTSQFLEGLHLMSLWMPGIPCPQIS